jgi:hypothetical protein
MSPVSRHKISSIGRGILQPSTETPNNELSIIWFAATDERHSSSVLGRFNRFLVAEFLRQLDVYQLFRALTSRPLSVTAPRPLSNATRPTPFARDPVPMQTRLNPKTSIFVPNSHSTVGPYGSQPPPVVTAYQPRYPLQTCMASGNYNLGPVAWPIHISERPRVSQNAILHGSLAALDAIMRHFFLGNPLEDGDGSQLQHAYYFNPPK